MSNIYNNIPLLSKAGDISMMLCADTLWYILFDQIFDASNTFPSASWSNITVNDMNNLFRPACEVDGRWANDCNIGIWFPVILFKVEPKCIDWNAWSSHFAIIM